jgi:hypothetical protein
MKYRFAVLLVPALMLAFSHTAWGGEAPPSKAAKKQEAEIKRIKAILEESKKKSPREVNDLTRTKVETRPCVEGDIMGGMWKMVYFRETPPKRDDKFNRKLKHQYITFDTARYYARIRSAKSIDNATKAIRSMKPDTSDEFAQKYIVNQANDRTEIIFMVGKTPVYRHSCSIVLKPVSAFKPGDMILTGYTQGGATLLYELYRRWF